MTSGALVAAIAAVGAGFCFASIGGPTVGAGAALGALLVGTVSSDPVGAIAGGFGGAAFSAFLLLARAEIVARRALRRRSGP